jgi:hypothetical protein
VPPVVNRSTFIDGDYGPSTIATVENYKGHYDIHFPPDQPTGTVDGFAGPRTLRRLDAHCVLLDEAIDAIEQKALDLTAAGVTVDLDVNQSEGRETVPILGTSGASRGADVDGDALGRVSFKRGLGAFAIHGALFKGWIARGLETGLLGFLTSHEHDDGPGFRRCEFEHGSLRLDTSTRQVTLIGNPQVPAQPF